MPIRRFILRGLWLPLVLWIAAVYLAFGRAYLVAFNLTESLPGTLFLIQKGTLPNRGDLVAFRWQANWP
jgi:conjugal transfer pilin signal peptidase TrbI